MILLKLINEKCGGGLESLRLRYALLDRQKRILSLEFSHPESLSKQQQQMIRQVVTDNVPNSLVTSITFVKDYIDKEIAIKALTGLMEENFHSIFSLVEEKQIVYTESSGMSELVLQLSKETSDVVAAMNFEEKIQEMLNSFTSKELIFKVEVSESSFDKEKNIKEIEAAQKLELQRVLSGPSRTIELEERREFIGEVITADPMYILDINKPENKATICGKVMKIWSKTLPNSTLFKFDLRDFTGQIPCVFFAKDGNVGKFSTVCVGDELLINGKIELSAYNGMLEFKAFKINKCKIGSQSVMPQIGKEANEEYLLIVPQDFQIEEQMLFEKKEENLPENFKGKSYVVFDFETTGIKVLQNKIIEIGAVKIENGKITKTFSTLINPECSISIEITALTGITNAMLENKPTIGQVMCDFYKFCEGSTLVAHHAEFDMGFLLYYAKPCGYAFTNEVLDTIAIAKKFYSESENRKNEPSNYKLSTLTQHLEVENTDAHRALADAIAAAKIFLKLYA